MDEGGEKGREGGRGKEREREGGRERGREQRPYKSFTLCNSTPLQPSWSQPELGGAGRRPKWGEREIEWVVAN